MKLEGRLVPIDDLTRGERGAMFALMDRYYENVRWPEFDADLAEKDWVIQLVDPRTKELCGFSTQVVLEVPLPGHHGGRVPVLFSGDTIVARERWGDPALAHVWGRLALALIEENGDRDLFWFLISKGYKTYRFLSVFFQEFYPRHDAPTPPRIQQVLHAVASHKFPGDYYPAAGVIRAWPGKDRLRPGVAELTPLRLADAHVAFFARANPGHAEGDELCCLAPLTRANFRPAAWRVIEAMPGHGQQLAVGGRA